MRVASVTLNLTPPVDLSVVASRELSFVPSSIDAQPGPMVVSVDASTVRDLRWLPDTDVNGTLVDVSPHGVRSEPAAFHFVCTLPEVVPTPTPPTVASIDPVEIPDPPQAAEAVADVSPAIAEEVIADPAVEATAEPAA